MEKLEESVSKMDDEELSDESPLLPRSPNLIKASERWLTVEPVLLICSLSIGIVITVNPQYLKQRLEAERNFTSSVDDYGENGTCNPENKSDPNYIIGQEIQAEVSIWHLIITVSGYLPALFMAPLLGAWGDKTGRKPTLAVTILGFTMYMAIYLFVTILELPLWVIVIGSFVSGFCGNYGLLLATCLAYVADVTTQEKRMIRIVVIQVTFVLGIGLSQILVGFLIQVLGFSISFLLSLIGLILSFIYLFMPPFLIETIPSNTSTTDAALKNIDLSKFQAVVELFRVDTDGRRVKLILVVLTAFSIEILAQSSIAVTIIYGLGAPFCWSSVVVGWYSAVVIIASAVGMAIGSKCLGRCLSDAWIMQVSNVFGIANGILNALANSTLGLFLVAAVTSMRAVDQPMFHLMLSKLVTAEEQGVMFAFESSVLNLASFMSPIILNSVYAATVSTHPNSVFYVMGFARIVPIALIGILQIIDGCCKAKDLRPSTDHKGKKNGDNSISAESESC